MLGIFRVVPTEERETPLPYRPVQVLDDSLRLVFGEHRHVRLHPLRAEARGQAVEVGQGPLVRLGEHGRDDVDLGAEIEEGEAAQRSPRGCVHLVSVNVAERAHRRVQDQSRIGEG